MSPLAFARLMPPHHFSRRGPGRILARGAGSLRRPTVHIPMRGDPMKRFYGAALIAACAVAPAIAQEPTAVVDKAIQAMGGEEKLSKAEAVTWKARGQITFNDNT